MKRFLKMFFLILFIGIIILTIVFNKRIMLCYGIAEKYISLKNHIWATNQKFDIETSSNSMNYSDVVYKNTNGISLTLDIYSPLKNIWRWPNLLHQPSLSIWETLPNQKVLIL